MLEFQIVKFEQKMVLETGRVFHEWTTFQTENIQLHLDFSLEKKQSFQCLH